MTTIIQGPTVLFSMVFLLSHNTPLFADEIHLGAEFDPGTTLVGTRNFFLVGDISGEHTSIAKHLTVSVGVFQADFPPWLQNVFSYRNRGKNIDSRIRLSPGASVDYFVENTNKRGWHVGMFGFLWRYRIESQDQGADFSRLVLLPRLGYRWYPFVGAGLYLDPFLGLMTELPISGSAVVAGKTHKPTPVLPFASVHVGYRF